MVPSVEALSMTMTSLSGYRLRQHRFQAALDKAAAVVSDYRDRDEVVLRHEREPENPYSIDIRIQPSSLGPETTTSSLQPKTSIGRRAAQPFRKPPAASSSACRADSASTRSKSPPPPPDTPPEMRAAESAWLNTSVDYDTNKRAASPLLSSRWNAPPYAPPRPPARSTKDSPGRPPGGRNPRPQTIAGRSASSKPPNSSHTAPADHQKRPRRLLHGHALRIIQLQSPIPPVHRISRPDPVQQ